MSLDLAKCPGGEGCFLHLGTTGLWIEFLRPMLVPEVGPMAPYQDCQLPVASLPSLGSVKQNPIIPILQQETKVQS